MAYSHIAGEMLADARVAKNGRHDLIGLFRRSVFGHLARNQDLNDAECLRHDPAVRWFVGGKAAQRFGAWPSQDGTHQRETIDSGALQKAQREKCTQLPLNGWIRPSTTNRALQRARNR